MHKVPFARLVLVSILSFGAFSGLFAQGACEAPGEFDFTTQVCPNGQGSAHSRYGPNPGYVWSTYQWTVTGGTIISGANAEMMYYVAGPSGNVEITLSVTSPSCSGTKTHTAIITSDQNAEIMSNSTVCPTSRSAATVMYGDSNSTYQWSITNGSFSGPTNGSNVQFIAGESGSVGLDVVVTNPGGSCNGTGHLDIPIAPPNATIETFGSDTSCPGRSNAAGLYGNIPYGSSFYWTITNGHIIGSPMQQSVEYVADGTAPVTLTASASGGDGCSLTISRTINLNTAPVPQLSTTSTTVCPDGYVTFLVSNASQFVNGIRWDWGSAIYDNQTPTSLTVRPNGTNPVKVTVYGQNPGCETSATITLPTRAPDATIHAPSAVCPFQSFTASLPDVGSGGQYQWTFSGDGQMQNVSLDGRTATFMAYGPTPLTINSWVYSSTGNCPATDSVTVTPGTQLQPTIHASLPFCGSGTASVDNASNYTSVEWQITNGVIDGPATGPTVAFHATSSSPVELKALVSNASGCTGTKIATVTPQAMTAPVLTTSMSSFCSTGSRSYVNLTTGPYQTIEWHLTNALQLSASPGNDQLEIRNIAEGPVMISVTVTDANGCSATASTTIPYETSPAPVIVASPDSHCGTSSTFGVQVSNASVYTQSGMWGFRWFARNGYVASSSGPYASIQPTSSTNPVEVYVEVWFNGCTVIGSTVVQPSSSNTPPPVAFGSTSICPNGSGSASVPPNYMSYSWSIQNGVIDGGSYGSNVYFHSNGAGPVTLSVSLYNPGSCPTTATGTLPLTVVAPPQIELGAADICPNGPGSAFTPQGNWAGFSWSIENGTISGNSTSNYVNYYANGSNLPVKLTLFAWTQDNCGTTATITQPIRTVAAPQIDLSAADLCPNGPGSAFTPQGNWAGFSWSIENGTISGNSTNNYVNYYADGSNLPVKLTLFAWTQDYCSATSTVTQPIRTVAAPQIDFSAADICPTGPGSAFTPQGNWAGFSWSIENGTISGSATNNYVNFYADGSRLPVKLTLFAWTQEYCAATSTATLPIRTVTAPPIDFSAPDLCPTGPGSASTPANWYGYSWSIQHGTISGSSNNNYVTYYGDGSGLPVQLTLQVWTQDYCTATSTATQPIRTVTAPPIDFSAPDLCPTGPGSASTPPNWYGYSWSIEHGTISGSSSNNFVTYNGDGSGQPVRLTLQVWTQEYCTATSTATQPIRTVTAPPIDFSAPDLCPTGPGSASTPPNWYGYNWTIEHGTINGSATNSFVTYYGDGSGQPVKLTLQVWTQEYCTATSTATQPIRTVTAPPIDFSAPDLCPTGPGSASTPPNWYGYNWTIENGTINGSSTNSFVSYHGDGSNLPVKLTLQVWTQEYCTATSTASQPVRTIAAPAITPSQPEACPGATMTASVPPNWYGYNWTIQNGTFNSSTTTDYVSFTATGSEAVVLTAQVWTEESCNATSSITIPVRTIAAPTITASGPTTFCEGGSVTLTASEGASYSWSNGATTRSITVTSAGAYSVSVSDGTCSANSQPVVVTVDAPVAANITVPSSMCEGLAGVAEAGDQGEGAQYSWSIVNGTIAAGNGTRTINFGANGTAPVQLTLTVTRGSCSSTQTKTITVNPRPVFTIVANGGGYESRSDENALTATPDDQQPANATFVMCGVTSVRLRPSVLDPTWSYVWSDGVTGPVRTVTANGTYTLTATNASGCVYSEPATVIMKPLPVVSISGTTQLCPNSTTTLTASGGDSYLWSTGATTASITVSTPGTYSVQATLDGCTASQSVTVTQAAAGITAGGPTTFCAGGSVTLTANAAQSYLWSNGATTQSITVTSSGTYTVQETFAGCTLTSDPVAVSAGPSAVSIAVDDNSVCPGQTIHFTSGVTGGANLTYQWLDGNGAPLGNGTTLDLTPSQPGYGSVSLTVTDANGCAVTSQTVTYYRYTVTTPVITPSGPTTFCEGQFVTLYAPSSSSYLWSNGSTAPFINVSASGSFTVTTVDNSGCSVTSDPVTVTVHALPATPSISASGPTTFCEGGSVTLSAPAGYSYSWSNGAATQSITVSATGTYTVTIANANGCTASASQSVTVNPPPASFTIGADGPTTFCEGGSVVLSAPMGYASYAWSGGETTRTITATAGGPYTVTVTNASGCTASASTSVTVNARPAAPSITASGATTFCEGGTVTLTAPAGYATYVWSNNVNTQSINVTQGGTYSVRVATANGCLSPQSNVITVTVNAKPATPVITANGATTFCEGGSVVLTAPAGYSYAWSNGGTTQSITVTASGAYSVSVSDANGCASAQSNVINVTAVPQPSAPTITAGGLTTFCDGGSVVLDAPAGWASYAWSNGATTQSITVTAGGAYSVVVGNATGCTSPQSNVINVTVNPAPAATPTINAGSATTFCDGGFVVLTASGGDGTGYLWSNGATSPSITVIATGTYRVAARNANGCTGPQSNPVTVTVNPKPAPVTITAAGATTFCEGSSVTLNAPGGHASYLWSNGLTTQNITVTETGNYSVSVGNASGCMSAQSNVISVTKNAAPPATITPSGPTALCPGASVTLSAPAGYSYSWSTGAITQSITVSAPGPYSVTVTNANGCSASSSITVTANAPTAITTQPQSATIARNVTRVLTVAATGTAPLTYQWYEGNSGDTSKPLAGQTSSSYTAGPFTKKGTYRYWVRVSSSTCTTSTVNSATAVITVN